jgi:hypothetical protein
MRKRFACGLLVLSCLVLSWGCREGGANDNAAQPADPDAVIAEINSFTDELLQKVDAASDPAAGVDEAQGFPDSRKEQLKARIDAARTSQKYREDAQAKGKFLDCEIENQDRVDKIRTRHLDRWMRDAAFKSKLDKLERDYRGLFESAGAPVR